MVSLLLAAAMPAQGLAAMTGPAAKPAPPAATPQPPAPPLAEAGKVAFDDNDVEGEAEREFSYTWPAAVSAIPELARLFTAERSRLLAEQKADWEEALAEFKAKECSSCASRSMEKTWEVVADVGGFLSLSQNIWEYSGGAHGNYGSGALIWDRAAKQALGPEDMFTSEQAIQDVLGPRWCKLLLAERRRRLGDNMPADDGLFPCPPIAQLTVLLGSKSKTHFDRIGLIADPYVAGSYVEGQYEITVPVTQDVINAVKPEYRAVFARGE